MGGAPLSPDIVVYVRSGHLEGHAQTHVGLRSALGLQQPLKELQDRRSSFSPTTPNPNANGLLGAVIYAGKGTGAAIANWFRPTSWPLRPGLASPTNWMPRP